MSDKEEVLESLAHAKMHLTEAADRLLDIDDDASDDAEKSLRIVENLIGMVAAGEATGDDDDDDCFQTLEYE